MRVGGISRFASASSAAHVAQTGEYTVELRLVGDRGGDGGRAVVLAGHVGLAEPG
jgi:hypothetical protein